MTEPSVSLSSSWSHDSWLSLPVAGCLLDVYDPRRLLAAGMQCAHLEDVAPPPTLPKKECQTGKTQRSSRQFHQTLPNLGSILGLGTSSVPSKTLGRIEPILSLDELLVLSRDRINPNVSRNRPQDPLHVLMVTE